MGGDRGHQRLPKDSNQNNWGEDKDPVFLTEDPDIDGLCITYHKFDFHTLCYSN